MINEPDGLDNRAKAVLASQTDGTISDDYAETWRMGEKVEATLIAERGPGNLIGVKGGLFMHADEFASVRPVDGDPAGLKALKTLRTQLVEERLAAASARSATTMARKETERVSDELARARRDANAVLRSYRLAVAALEHIRTLDYAGPMAPLPFLDTLLPTGDRPGSLAEPCGAVLTINDRYPGCSCETPCMEEVASFPCMLRRGHMLVAGKEKHYTVAGRAFETGEVGHPDDDQD